MRISEDKLNELYLAIYKPITDFRVDNYTLLSTLDGLDRQLFNLELEIFQKVKTALNILKD